MKIFLLVLLVVVFLPMQAAYAQLVVVDTVLDALLTASGLEQHFYFAQQLADNITQIDHFVTMI